MSDLSPVMDVEAEDPCAANNDNSMTGLRIGAIFIILVRDLTAKHRVKLTTGDFIVRHAPSHYSQAILGRPPISLRVSHMLCMEMESR